MNGINHARKKKRWSNTCPDGSGVTVQPWSHSAKTRGRCEFLLADSHLRDATSCALWDLIFTRYLVNLGGLTDENTIFSR